jgi:hypothetical protein
MHGAVLVLVAILSVAVAAALRRWNILPSQEHRLIVEEPVDEVVFRATARLLLTYKNAIAIVHRSTDSLTVTRYQRAHADTGCLLGLFRHLYLDAANKDLTTSLVATETEHGTQLVVSGTDSATRRALERWCRQNLRVVR